MGDPTTNPSDRTRSRGAVEQLLAHVGSVRSEILVFSILASLLLFTFSTSSESHDFTATVMRIAGIVMLFLGFGFYVYAYRRLPASTQEVIFTQQAIQEISKTRSAIERRKRSLV